MAMDELFDLDLALTMEVPNNISLSSPHPDDQISKSSKSEESERINNIMGYACTTIPSNILSVAGTHVCTVCMEGFESSTGGGGGKQVRCGHVYHANCITKWLSLHHSCPLCRSPILFQSPENYSSSCNT